MPANRNKRIRQYIKVYKQTTPKKYGWALTTQEIDMFHEIQRVHKRAYLYMILSRSEFDRYSRYNSWGSARETFDWEELCRVKIPLPPIEVQRSIVNLYNCLEEAKKIVQEAKEKMKTLCPALVQKAVHS